MRCSKCEKEAIGICRFCGRGVCEDHIHRHLYIPAVYTGKDDDLYCLAVKNALYCGVCEPVPVPVKISPQDIEKAYKAKKPI